MILLNMMAYGITTIVETTQEKIDHYMNAYSTQPDERFGGGAGKSALLEYIQSCVEREDAYFNSHPIAQSKEHVRWSNFLEDCIIYATLNTYLNLAPLPVMFDETPMMKFIREIEEQLGHAGTLNSLESE